MLRLGKADASQALWVPPFTFQKPRLGYSAPYMSKSFAPSKSNELRAPHRIHRHSFLSAPRIRKLLGLLKTFIGFQKANLGLHSDPSTATLLAVTLAEAEVSFVFCKLRTTAIPTWMSTHAKSWMAPGTKVLAEWSETLLADLAFGKMCTGSNDVKKKMTRSSSLS